MRVLPSELPDVQGHPTGVHYRLEEMLNQLSVIATYVVCGNLQVIAEVGSARKVLRSHTATPMKKLLEHTSSNAWSWCWQQPRHVLCSVNMVRDNIQCSSIKTAVQTSEH